MKELLIDFEKIVITGVQVQYYFINPKQLWYFSKGITMEHESDLVAIGKLISQESFIKDKKEIQVGRIKIDFYRKKLEIHEVKKSSKFKEASRWQLIYYLYVLKKFGVNCIGILHFHKEKKTEKVLLTPEREKRIVEILRNIEKIIKLPKPPQTIQSERIKKSSYYEFFMA